MKHSKQTKNTLISVIAGLAAMTVVSCSTKEMAESPVSYAQEGICFRPIAHPSSRATDVGFEDMDVISVFAVCKSESNPNANIGNVNWADNIKYEFSDGLFVGVNGNINKPDEFAELGYYAIYPYNESAGQYFDFSVLPNQSTHEGYTASDLMTARIAPTQSKCPELVFSHKMSKISVNLSFDVYPSEEVKAYILGSRTKVLYDLVEDIPYAYDNQVSAIMACPDGTNSWKAIIVPQSIPSETKLFSFIIGGTAYNYITTTELQFESGKQYFYDFKIRTTSDGTKGIEGCKEYLLTEK